MTKRKMMLLITGIALLTIVFIAAGLILQQSDSEKRTGLSDVYDVDHNGRIGFIRYEKGKPAIYIKTKQKEQQLKQLEDTTPISDIAFSADNNKLLYSIIDKDSERTELHMLDVHSGDSNLVLKEGDALITEIHCHPDNPDVFYYLKAATFENYSPIASARPHDLDLYQYEIGAQKEEKLTDLAAYAMESLQLAEDGETAYVQMFEEDDSDTAEAVFEAKQRIFEIPLKDTEEPAIINVPDSIDDIYAFTMLPGDDDFIYQAISNLEAGDTFQYELYTYDSDTKDTEQLTNVQSYAGEPVLSEDGKTVYFIVNETFAKEQPTFQLFALNLETGESRAVLKE